MTATKTRKSRLIRRTKVGLWRSKRWVRRNRGPALGVLLLLLPIVGVLWVAGLPGGKTPAFVNFAIQASCAGSIEPTIHIQVPDAATRDRDLKAPGSQARVTIQFVPTLSNDDTPACKSVGIFADAELLKPAMITSGADVQTAPPLWFYVDAVRGYGEEPVSATRDPNGWGWSIDLEGDGLEKFAGAVTFELAGAIERTSISTTTLSMSLLMQGVGTVADEPVSAGASIVMPPDYRLIQDLTIPAPVNVLASNRGPRYEFTLRESRLGNAANDGHWVSFHAVMEDTVWAKWQEYLLFVFSGLFGFGVGFFFEAILSRRALAGSS